MTQTETVYRQALEERVRPILYINKIDRLIKELRLGPEAMQKWLFNIVADFNRLIDTYAEKEYKEKWKVTVAAGQVAFGSSKDKWGFNAVMAKRAGMSFKDIIDAYLGEGPENLGKKLPLHEALLGMVVKHHPPARRGAGLPHPQDLAGRPHQRRRQVAPGVRRERPDGHDGHKRRRRPRGRARRCRQALLRLGLQRRPRLPAQL